MKLKKLFSSVLIAILIGATTVVAGDVANLNEQLVVDGNMERVNTTAYTASSVTLTKETTNPYGGDQILKVEKTGASTGSAYQNILTIGKTYRVTGWGRGDGTAEPRIGDTSYRWEGTNSTSWQYFDVTFISNDGNFHLYVVLGGTGDYAEFDDVVVTQVQSGDWKNLNKQILADGNMEAATTGAWGVGNVGTLTKETTNPHGGSQVLRVAYNTTPTPYAYQAIVIIGKTYRITGWARGDATYLPRVRQGGIDRWVGTNSTSWQYFDLIYAAIGTTQQLFTCNASAAGYCEFDDIVVTEVQHGDAKNLYKQVLVDGNMERALTTAWSGGNNAILTKETTNPHGGNLTLKIAYNSTFSPYAKQFVLTSGKRYRVTGWAHGDGSKAPKIIISPWTSIWSGSASEEWQYIDEVFISGGTGIHLVTDTSAAGYSVFDDIVVTEMP